MLYRKYIVTEYDYNVKKNRFVCKFNEKYNALEFLLTSVIEYLEEKDGSEKTKNIPLSNYLFDRKNFRSAVRKSLSPGHYIVRDTTEHIYKLEIWCKTIIKSPGKVFGEWVEEKWTKVIDMDLLETEVNIENSREKEYAIKDPFNPLWDDFTNSLIKTNMFKNLSAYWDENPSFSMKKLKDTYPEDFYTYKK